MKLAVGGGVTATLAQFGEKVVVGAIRKKIRKRMPVCKRVNVRSAQCLVLLQRSTITGEWWYYTVNECDNGIYE